MALIRGRHSYLKTWERLFSPKVLARRLTTWCSSSYEDNVCFIIPKRLDDFYNWMFSFSEDNYGTRLKKTRVFNTLPIFRGCPQGDNLLSSSSLLFTCCLIRQQISPKTPELSYYFYNAKCMYGIIIKFVASYRYLL